MDRTNAAAKVREIHDLLVALRLRPDDCQRHDDETVVRVGGASVKS